MSDRADEPPAWIDDDFDRALPRIIAEAGEVARASCQRADARMLELVREEVERVLKENPWQSAVRR